MTNGRVENREVLAVCEECANYLALRNKPCAFRWLDNSFCDEVEKADNALSHLKKCVIDTKTALMHKEIKKDFKDYVESKQ